MENESVHHLHDRWGYPVRTVSPLCISSINSFYDQVLRYGRNRKIILEAVEHDRHCVLANTLAATFLSRHQRSAAQERLAVAAAHVDEATTYEKAVFEAVSCMLAEEADEEKTLFLHSKLLEEFPKDLLSLKRVQILCFYLGRSDLSLKFVKLVLPRNQNENYIYGMLAFPLLELGKMKEAEDAALNAIKIDAHDFWAQHNLCHVYQNNCQFKEAVRFMKLHSSMWTTCSSFLFTHNWWHVAVCYLEGHAPIEKVLKIYDGHIKQELDKDDAECGEVYLNALGLLLRVVVRGKFNYVKERLETIANAFTNKDIWHIEWLLDLLALWALSISQENDKAVELLDGIKLRISKMNKTRKQSMQKLEQLAEALYEFGKGNDQKVYDLLGPDFDAANYKMIGASDEQLDVFNEVWYTVLLSTKHSCKAIQQIDQKVKEREGAPFLWHLLGKAYSLEGRQADASLAEDKAEALEKAYFKQPSVGQPQ